GLPGSEKPGPRPRPRFGDLDQQPPAGEAVARGRKLDPALARIAVEQGPDQLQRDRLARDGARVLRAKRGGTRFKLVQRVGIERPAEEQPPLRAGRRDVGEARFLLRVALGRELGELLIVVEALGRAAEASELDTDPRQLPALWALLAGTHPKG